MTGAKRAAQALRLALFLAAIIGTSSASTVHAAGYWACTGDAWTAVGQPEHAKPSRPCGSRLDIPRTQVACEQTGGRWGRAGLFPHPICRMPTRDAGRVCGDTGECDGFCLATLTPAQRDLLMRQRQKLPMLGTCTPYTPTFGCMAIVREGFVTGLMCLD